jgi:hypothetical protein
VRTNAAYAAAKTGLSSLVKSVALGYASFGITCNAVCPGLTDTEYLSPADRKALAAKNPDGRLVEAAEVARAGLFLLSEGSVNGVFCPWIRGGPSAHLTREGECDYSYDIREKTDTLDGRRSMNNNTIIPGFDEEKDDSLKIRLEKIDDVEGCIVFI